MYSPSMTDRFLEAQMRADPTFKAIRHSRADVDTMIDVLADAWDPEQGVQTRKLSREEIDFITNEQIVCTHDFRYFVSSYCNTPDAPIAMSDWSFKNIGDIQIGDSVIGWSRQPYKGSSKYAREWYEKATVVAIKRRIAPVIELTMESGQKVRCTPDHLWSTGSSTRNLKVNRVNRHGDVKHYHYPWTVPKAGRFLRACVDPKESVPLSREDEIVAAWLGGIFDGEGSGTPNGFQIAQSQSHNPIVCSAIASALKRLGFDFTFQDDRFSIRGGHRARVKFINLCKPVRRHVLDVGTFKSVYCYKDRIIDIKIIGDREVVSMQTTTGNYIAWGYLSKNCHIIDFEKRLVHFTPNAAQLIVLDIWSEMEELRWAIMMLQLKARQLGVSTLTELAVMHRLQFWSEVDAVVASSTPEKSAKMSKMMRVAWDHMPWWLMPRVTAIKDGLPVEFRDSHGTLDVSAGNKFSGVGRGSTPGVVHVSEICEWPNPSEDIDASLLNAIHETPEVFFVIESTALGRGNWFHDKWRTTKKNWGGRGSKLCPIFLPFYVGRDIYPDEGWILKHPVPPRWEIPDRITALAQRCEAEVQHNDRLRKHLGSAWVMPKEMLWWYFFTEAEHRDNEQLNKFRSECSSNDLECFNSTGHSAFSQEVIEVHRDRRSQPVGVYKLVGKFESEEEIPILHRPTAIEEDRSKPRIPIHCVWGRYEGHFELVPIKYQGDNQTNPMGLIFIYEHPKPGYDYGYGCDTAEGIGGDRSVLEFIRKDSITEPDVQVCEFASDFVSGLELWPWCMALGTYYSPPTEDGRMQALSSIEVRTGGDALQYELRKRGWARFLIWPRVLDSKRINLAHANKLGFVTNAWSRPNMVNIILTWINRDRILINSPWFIEEMEAFEKEEEGQKMKAAFGEHDDRIMALGFILFAFHIHEIHSNKITLADRREAQAHEDDPEYDVGWQGRERNVGELEQGHPTVEMMLRLHGR